MVSYEGVFTFDVVLASNGAQKRGTGHLFLLKCHQGSARACVYSMPEPQQRSPSHHSKITGFQSEGC